MRRLTCAILALLAPQIAGAASVAGCDRPLASAANVMSFDAAGHRSFANGAIRLIWLDTTEPACCSSHLMVQMFHATEMGQSCWIVSADDGELGFGGFDLPGARATYDPARGLTVAIPANVFGGDGPVPALLTLTLDQGAQTIAVDERPR